MFAPCLPACLSTRLPACLPACLAPYRAGLSFPGVELRWRDLRVAVDVPPRAAKVGVCGGGGGGAGMRQGGYKTLVFGLGAYDAWAVAVCCSRRTWFGWPTTQSSRPRAVLNVAWHCAALRPHLS